MRKEEQKVPEELEDLVQKVCKGLELSKKRLIEFKRYKKSPLIVSKDGKIVEIDVNTIKDS